MTVRDILTQLATEKGWGESWLERWLSRFPDFLRDADATLTYSDPPVRDDWARITLTLTRLVFSVTSDGFIIGLDPERGV